MLILAVVTGTLAIALFIDWRFERNNRRSLLWSLAVFSVACVPSLTAVKMAFPDAPIHETMTLQVGNVLFTTLLAAGHFRAQRRKSRARRILALGLIASALVIAGNAFDRFMIAFTAQTLILVPVTVIVARELLRTCRANQSTPILPLVLYARVAMYLISGSVFLIDSRAGGVAAVISQSFYTFIAVAMALHIMAERRATVNSLHAWMRASGEIAALPSHDTDLTTSAYRIVQLIHEESTSVACGILQYDADDGSFMPVAYAGETGELRDIFRNLPVTLADDFRELNDADASFLIDTWAGRYPVLRSINAIRQHRIRFVLVMPLRLGERSIGTIFVAFRPSLVPDRSIIRAGDVIARAVSPRLELTQRVEQIRNQARADSLTGLPNRLALHEEFTRRFDGSGAPGSFHGFMMLVDLDRFKDINDSLGHLMGDRVLIQVAERLRGFCLRFNLFAVRLGGDEFALLSVLERSAERDAVMHCATELNTLLRDALDIEDLRLSVDSSIGISLFPANGDNSHELLRCADIAMYHAKTNGLKAAFYDENLEGDNRERLELTSLVHSALEKKQFELYFQPQIRLEDGVVIGAEALLRWNEPVRGWIPPAQFIPLIELGPLIDPISLWVAEAAIGQIRRWHAAGHDWTIAINVSARNLQSDGWCEQLVDLIRESGVPEGSLEIEITETSLMANPDEVSRRLRMLADCGAHIALDDFGTGYSSLSYLQQQDFDTLKIDRSFVQGLELSEQGRQLVGSMILMASNLGIQVVAEGVESWPANDLLREAGCHYGQGYLYAAPMPAKEFEAWARAR